MAARTTREPEVTGVLAAVGGVAVLVVLLYPAYARPVVHELDDAGAVLLRRGWLRQAVAIFDITLACVVVPLLLLVAFPGLSFPSGRLWTGAGVLVVWVTTVWHLVSDGIRWWLRIDEEAITWRMWSTEGRIDLRDVAAVEPAWTRRDNGPDDRRGTWVRGRDGSAVLLPRGTPLELLERRFPRADWRRSTMR